MRIYTEDNLPWSNTIIEKPETDLVKLLITTDYYGTNSPSSALLGTLAGELLLAGAGKYNRSEFLHALELLGTQIKVMAGGGRITLSLETSTNKLPSAWSLFHLMLTKPQAKTNELLRCRRTLQNRLEARREEARPIAHRNLTAALFPQSSYLYQFSIPELLSVLPKITYRDTKNILPLVLSLPWTVTVAGNKKSNQFLTKALLDLKSQTATKPIVAAEDSRPKEVIRRQVVTELVPGKQNIEISFGASLPLTLNDEEFPAFLFGLNVLAKWGGFSGRLMKTVREKEGLTYGIYAQLLGASTTRAGYWRIMTFFAPSDAKQGITSTLREIDNLATRGITSQEHQRFRTILQTDWLLTGDSLFETATSVHTASTLGLPYPKQEALQEKLLSVSKSDVNRVLKKYLAADKLVISTAGSITSVRQELSSFNQAKRR